MGHSLSSSDYNTTTSTAEIQDIVKCLARPENKKRAMACLNALVADALELVPDCLEYMSLLQEPSVFSFAAIPQVCFFSYSSFNFEIV